LVKINGSVVIVKSLELPSDNCCKWKIILNFFPVTLYTLWHIFEKIQNLFFITQDLFYKHHSDSPEKLFLKQKKIINLNKLKFSFKKIFLYVSFRITFLWFFLTHKFSQEKKFWVIFSSKRLFGECEKNYEETLFY